MYNGFTCLRLIVAAVLLFGATALTRAEEAPAAMRWEYDPTLTIAALQAHRYYALVAVTSSDRQPSVLYFQSREMSTFDVVRCFISAYQGARCERLK